MVVAVGAPHARTGYGGARDDIGELPLHPRELRPGGARGGEAEQRHHPIGLDFEEPLHHAAEPAGGEGAVADQDPAEAIIGDAEIGPGFGIVAADRRTDQVRRVEDGTEALRRSGGGRGGFDAQIDRDQAGRRQRFHQREQGFRQIGPGLARIGIGGDMGERGELGVALPADHPVVGGDQPLPRTRRRDRCRELAAEGGQVIEVARRTLLAGLIGEMGDQRRLGDAERRPGMDLVVEIASVGMFPAHGSSIAQLRQRPPCGEARQTKEWRGGESKKALMQPIAKALSFFPPPRLGEGEGGG